MKIYWLFMELVLCMVLTGCAHQPLISPEDNLENVESPNKAPTVAPDWSNWRFSLPGGGAMNLLSDENGTSMLNGEVNVENGELSVYLQYLWKIDGWNEGEAKAIVIVAVNEKVCDFELNGIKSENGILFEEQVVGKQKIESLKINDCKLVQGENKLSVHLIAYFPAFGHSNVLSLERTFESAENREQTKDYSYLFNEFQKGEIRKEENNSYKEFRDFIYDQLAFSQTNYCTTVRYDGGVKYCFTNNGGTTGTVPVDCNAVCLVLKNGELIPAWDGHPLLMMQLTGEDKEITLPIFLDAEQGEMAQYIFFFLDVKNGMSFFTERLFLFQ